MKEPRKTVKVQELLKLLMEVQQSNADVNVRVRLMGGMWENNFMRVARAATNVVMLTSKTTGKSLLLSDVSVIVQFELDTRFQHYQPNFHYNVSGF
jgi:citrate lyase beta subunit